MLSTRKKKHELYYICCCEKQRQNMRIHSLVCIKDRSDVYAYLRHYVKATYLSKMSNKFKDF